MAPAVPMTTTELKKDEHLAKRQIVTVLFWQMNRSIQTNSSLLFLGMTVLLKTYVPYMYTSPTAISLNHHHARLLSTIERSSHPSLYHILIPTVKISHQPHLCIHRLPNTKKKASCFRCWSSGKIGTSCSMKNEFIVIEAIKKGYNNEGSAFICMTIKRKRIEETHTSLIWLNEACMW